MLIPEVGALSCELHDGAMDCLVARDGGIMHAVKIPVPVKAMRKAGTYRFVLHFKDSYADRYKDHEARPALEVNAYRGFNSD